MAQATRHIFGEDGCQHVLLSVTRAGQTCSQQGNVAKAAHPYRQPQRLFNGKGKGAVGDVVLHDLGEVGSACVEGFFKEQLANGPDRRRSCSQGGHKALRTSRGCNKTNMCVGRGQGVKGDEAWAWQQGGGVMLYEAARCFVPT